MKTPNESLLISIAAVCRRARAQIELKNIAAEGELILMTEEEPPDQALARKIQSGEINVSDFVEQASAALQVVPQHEAEAGARIALLRGEAKGAEWAVSQIETALLRWHDEQVE